MYIYTHIYKHIYIYIYRERERERDISRILMGLLEKFKITYVDSRQAHANRTSPNLEYPHPTDSSESLFYIKVDLVFPEPL